jgi:1-acyl-sn-glycerol-3-phosphate acyltransferase
VLIANHTSYYDALILGSLFNQTNRVGFVASDIITSMVFGRAVMSVFPHVIVKPSQSSYSQIANFFSKNPEESRLLIFPEGMLTHYKSICKFRSGAFVTGYPVQPIIIKYKQNVFDLLGFDMLCQEQIDVEVYVCNPIETDGSKDSIEKIRSHMAKLGEFFLSDVSNRKI